MNNILRRWSSRIAMISLAAVAAAGARTVFADPAGSAANAVGGFGVYRNDAGEVVVLWRVAPGNGVAAVRTERRHPGEAWSALPGGYLAVPTDPGESSVVADPTATDAGIVEYRLEVVADTGGSDWVGPFAVDLGALAPAPVSPALPPRGGLVLEPTGPEGDRVKITVRDDAVYSLSALDIAGCLTGVSTSQVVAAVAAEEISLTRGGGPVPWIPASGDDGIVFFGAAIDSLFTLDNVYWLELGAGYFMDTSGGSAPGSAVSGGVFPDTVTFEENLTAPLAYFTDPEESPWLWKMFHSLVSSLKSADFAFDLHGVDPAYSNATVRVYMKGGSSLSNINPDHNVRVLVNTVEVGTLSWDGFAAFDDSFPVTNLVNGANTLRLEVTDVDLSIAYLDRFDVSYDRQYGAVDDQLILVGDTNSAVSVSGFTTSDLRVIDIEDPDEPLLVDAVLVDTDTNGLYRATFDPDGATTPYCVAAGARAPRAIAGRVSAGLSSPTNDAEYVVITAPALAADATDLVDYRAGQGLAGRTVLFEDVCDEFNDGVASPVAIRDFLAHAVATWTTPPRYVVLLGNGTYDYKDHRGKGDNLVPTAMYYAPGFGLRSSDNPLADFDADLVIDIPIGRFPVVSSAQAQGMLAKIEVFEAAAGGWKDELLMLADDAPDPAGDFPASSDAVAAYVTDPMFTVDKLYQTTQSIAEVNVDLLSRLDTNGYRVLNYLGHGNLMIFGDQPGFLKQADVPVLTNATHAPVVCALTCDAGTFMHPGYDGLCELLVNTPTGGGVAAWAATAPAYNTGSSAMDESLFESLFVDYEVRLGDAILFALEEYAASYGGNPPYPFLLTAYCLLGDPATVLAPTGFCYEEWVAANFSPAELADPLVSGRSADPDGDSISNLGEFGWDLDPWVVDGAVVPGVATVTVPDGGGGSTTATDLTWSRRKWVEGAGYVVQTTEDLVALPWTDADPGDYEVIDRSPVDDLTEQLQLRFPEGAGPGFYGRILFRAP